MAPLPRPSSPKTPFAHRIFLPLLALSSVAAAPLDEAEVIRLARRRAPDARVAAATRRLAAARAEAAGLFANPALEWERETVETDPRQSQDILRAQAPVDVARPLARRALAGSQGAWMHARAARRTNEAVLEAVLTFYDAVLARRRLEVLEGAVENLEEAARVLERREAAGFAAGYERARLDVALELARSRRAEVEGRTGAAAARLGALLGLDSEALSLSPSLSLIGLDEESAIAERGPSRRPALKAAQEALRLGRAARARAKWAWLPTIEIGAGWKHTRGPGAGDGYFAGVAVEVPLFDHGQGIEAEAEAQVGLSEARAEALERTARMNLASAYARYRTARAELLRFTAGTRGAVQVMLRAAKSGYQEGEMTVLELLDAQRARVEVAERQLELLGAAKRAEARVRAAAGEL